MAISPIQGGTPVFNNTQFSAKAEIVKSSSEVSFSVKEQPLSLVYQSAVQKLNEFLAPELGADAIQSAASSGMDFSPEAVADRIVSFATSFFSSFAEKNNGLAEDEQLSEFMSIIRGAIDQGFREARDILEGLAVLQGDIKDNVDKTYDLIQDGLNSFEAGIIEGFGKTE